MGNKKNRQPFLPGTIVNLPGLSRMARLINRVLHKLGVRIVANTGMMVPRDWIDRLMYFSRLLRLVEGVEGNIVECGVADGSSLMIFAILNRNAPVKRHIWGFDSFEGLPEPGPEDLSSLKSIARKNMFPGSVGEVINNLKRAGLDDNAIREQVTLVKGWFVDTLPDYKGSIALLHIDSDLYESNKCALENLWDKMSIGGVAAFDDYLDTERFPGDKKAIDEFFSSYNMSGDVKILRDPLFPRCYAIKLK